MRKQHSSATFASGGQASLIQRRGRETIDKHWRLLMPHKSQEARNEYMRDYKVRRRADPAFKQRERERERERYAERKEQTRDQRLSKNARYRER